MDFFFFWKSVLTQMFHHRGRTLWFLFGHSEALQSGQKAATSKRLMRNISQWLHIYLFDALCFLACSVPLVYFGGNGRFMDLLCYFASLRQEPFFCWQAAWWQRATSLTVCQLCMLYVVHQTLWLWQPDAYLWFVWGEINVYLDARKAQFGCACVNFELTDVDGAKDRYFRGAGICVLRFEA